MGGNGRERSSGKLAGEHHCLDWYFNTLRAHEVACEPAMLCLQYDYGGELCKIPCWCHVRTCKGYP